jgi:hypothetical protein
MRGYRPARQPFTFISPHAVGSGPVVGLLVIIGMVLLLAALAGK